MREFWPFVLLYMLPALIAYFRRCTYRRELTLANIAFGWTGVGWLIALGVALLDVAQEKEPPAGENEHSDIAKRLSALEKKTTGRLQDCVRQANAQYAVFLQVSSKFKELITSKIPESERLHHRYLGGAERMSGALEAGYERLVSLLETLDAMNYPYIEERRQAITKTNCLSQDDQREKTALEERAVLFREHLLRAEQALAQAESAITALSSLRTKIADLNLISGETPLDVEDSMAEVSRLLDAVPIVEINPLTGIEKYGIKEPAVKDS